MIKTRIRYIAISDSGNRVMLTTDTPRKELMEYLGAKHAEKIYVDTKEGEVAHIGYIIGGEWYTLYAVEGRGPRSVKK